MREKSDSTPDYPVPVVDLLNAVVRKVARTAAWLNLVLIGVILAQVVLRYGFNHGLVPLEELMWHLYSVAVLFGLAHAMSDDSHIRVDILHGRFSERARRLIEIGGILLLLMPFLWIVFDHSLSWVADSYRVDEGSPNPQGLPHRWLIKSMIPIGFALLFLAALARLIRETLLLFRRDPAPDESIPTKRDAPLPPFRVQTARARKPED